MVSTSVVINEVATRGPSPNNALNELIELRNVSLIEQNIGNWQLKACNTDGTEVLLTTIPAGTMMAPRGEVGQFFLVTNADGYNAATAADREYSGVAVQDAGGVRLLNDVGTEIDAVGFTDGLECTETAAAEAQTAAEDPDAKANSRNVVSADTDVNQIDFKKLPRDPKNRFS